MNKDNLIKAVAADLEISQVKARSMVESVLTNIGSALVSGEDVNLVGFGSFKTVPVEARMRRNPATGEQVIVEAHKRIAFKASNILKESVW